VAERTRDAELTATLASAADPEPLSPPRPQAPKTPNAPSKSNSKEPESTAPPVRVAPSRSTAEAAPAEESSAPPDGVARTVALAIVAFGAAFVFFRWVVVPALAPPDPVEATPAPSAIVAAARGSAAPSAGPAMNVQNLALPDAFDPGPGRGLLEVVTAPADSIYVDGTFVGKGPGRSIPAPAGRHEVKIVRADAEHTTFVELTAGRRIRLGLELEAGAAPRP
jgi:hypothetical protein